MSAEFQGSKFQARPTKWCVAKTVDRLALSDSVFAALDCCPSEPALRPL